LKTISGNAAALKRRDNRAWCERPFLLPGREAQIILQTYSDDIPNTKIRDSSE
jgi:hypothetical protein